MIGKKSSFSINITRIKDGKELLSYHNPNLETKRPDNNFIRPKWGIYRSLKKVEDLKTEVARFADFLITEGTVFIKK